MKLVRIKNAQQKVRCSFCKVNLTAHRIQGGSYGGRSSCFECFEELQKKESPETDGDSLGEEQAYSLYGV